MPTINRWTRVSHIATSYVLAPLMVILTTLVRLVLDPLLGRKAALIMYFPALVLSAWAGGWGGGLLALALSALAATYFFLSGHHNLSVTGRSDQLTLVIFAVVGLSVSALSASQRRARQEAEDAAADARSAEMALRDREASLRDSEARKSAVLEVALDCIITTDARGNILEFNPAAERTFGYARADVLGRPISETIVPPSLREAHLRGLAHYVATGEGRILRRRIEVVGMRKDGSELPVEVAIIPMGEGDRLGFTAYLRDITASKNAAALQRSFLRDVLASVTQGHLILCDTTADLPAALPPKGEPIPLSQEGGLRELRHMALDASVGMNEECRHDLITAVSEAAMNAVTHGGGNGTGFVGVGADGTVQVRVEDQGTGIALEALPKATLARGFSTKASLGHGFKMMQQVDRVFVLTGPAGTTVVLEQGREPVPLAWL